MKDKSKFPRPAPRVRAGLLGIVGVLAISLTSVAEAIASPPAPTPFTFTTGLGLNTSYWMTTDGPHVWITNFGGNSVTEVNASDGSVVNIFNDASYNFSGPVGIAWDGTHIWVTNIGNSSITEMNGDGSFVRSISGAEYQFSYPLGIYSNGTNVFVANNTGFSVTEFSATTGALVQVLTDASYNFNFPCYMTFAANNLWVSNPNNDSITEIDPATGSLVRVLSGGSYGFAAPQGTVAVGNNLWITNFNGNSVTEIDATTGGWIRTLSSGYNFGQPVRAATDGTSVWVINATSNFLTRIDATTGNLIEALNGGAYSFDGGYAVTYAKNAVWVASTGNNILTMVLYATLPGSPRGARALAGDSSATVSWSAPTSDGGSEISRYEVTSSPAGHGCTVSATSCTVTGLRNGTSYVFHVVAVNKIGAGNPSSTPVIVPFGENTTVPSGGVPIVGVNALPVALAMLLLLTCGAALIVLSRARTPHHE